MGSAAPVAAVIYPGKATGISRKGQKSIYKTFYFILKGTPPRVLPDSADLSNRSTVKPGLSGSSSFSLSQVSGKQITFASLHSWKYLARASSSSNL